MTSTCVACSPDEVGAVQVRVGRLDSREAPERVGLALVPGNQAVGRGLKRCVTVPQRSRRVAVSRATEVPLRMVVDPLIRNCVIP